MNIEHDALAAVLPVAPLGPGSVVGGRYRILTAIGQGGMGAVFEAENVRTLKRVAVKWLHPRHALHVHAQERLLREARATSRIRHRNVVDMFDVVVDGEAVVLVMELLSGEPLATRLARRDASLAEVVRWLVAVMEGLAAAHAIGVIHRDIKPENIFLAEPTKGAEPVAKLIDFGICKTFDPDVADLTQSGMAIGTPRYISFEQLRGDRSVDARCDVYALGVILYEALLGRPPYRAGSLGEQAVQFVTYDPPAPSVLRPELPAALSCAVVKAIARDRELRFDSVEHLLAALRPFADDRAWPHEMMVWQGPPALPEGAVGGDVPTAPAQTRASSSISQPLPKSPQPTARRSGRSIFVLLATVLVLAVCVALTHRLGADVKRPPPPTTVVASSTHARPAAEAPDVAAAPPGEALARVTDNELPRAASELASTVSIESSQGSEKVPTAGVQRPTRRTQRKRKNDVTGVLDTSPASVDSPAGKPDQAAASEPAQTPGVGEDSSHRAGRVSRREF